VTPGLLFALTPGLPFGLTPGLPFGLLSGFPLARTLVIPFALVASPKLGLRQKKRFEHVSPYLNQETELSWWFLATFS